MSEAVNFCGASGASYRFERLQEDGGWAGDSGTVLFASGDCSGWRIIDVAVLGAAGGGQALEWRWRKARRYGASAVFVRRAATPEIGRLEASDLRLGLDPVFAAPTESASLAA